MALIKTVGSYAWASCLVVSVIGCETGINLAMPEIEDGYFVSDDGGRVEVTHTTQPNAGSPASKVTGATGSSGVAVSGAVGIAGSATGGAGGAGVSTGSTVTTGVEGKAGKGGQGRQGKGGTVAAAGGTGATIATGGTIGAGGATGTDPGIVVPDVGILDNFSFFVTSLAAIQELSGNEDGFGGDLRFGETGAGAGLRGADKICATIAEKSMPGAASKVWRAFLSATADENGNQVNAIDRIGNGPWYDRRGRVLALAKADLLSTRPQGADPAIVNDFPNEDGVPNHQPDPTQAQVDNHDFLTGTNAEGQLYGDTATCQDWTTSDGNASNGRPRVGHSWPRAGGIPLGDGSMSNWMSSLDEAGCAPGAFIIERGPPLAGFENNVGSGGGYGGFYCFALAP